VAWDTGREAWRSFRVDRITGAQPTGVRTEPRAPPGGDAAAYVRDTLYGSAPVYTAVATVHLPASQVEGRLGDGPGDVEPIGEGSCRVRSHTDTQEWLAFRLAMLGYAFEVHEPPELVGYLRALGARVTAATAADRGRSWFANAGWAPGRWRARPG
jgi:predicted DNA-binding transcriptional regulator YafY